MSNKYKITEEDNEKLKKYMAKWEKMDGEERSTIKRVANKVNIMTPEDYNHFKVLLSSLKLKGIHARSMIDVEIMRILDTYYNFNEKQSNRFYDIIFLEIKDDSIIVSKARSGIYTISKYVNSESTKYKSTHSILNKIYKNTLKLVNIEIDNIDLYDLEDVYCDEMDLRNLESDNKKVEFKELSSKFDKWKNYDSKMKIFENESEYKHFFVDFLYDKYDVDANSIIIKDGESYYTTTDVIQGYNDSNYIFNHRTIVKSIRDSEGVLYKNYLGIRVREFELISALQ